MSAPAPVRVVARKWPDRPHWEYDGLLLGHDAHGTWVGAVTDTLMSRPGAAFHTDRPQVSLFPVAGTFVATFYERGGQVPCDVYVDIATLGVRQGDSITSIDLDLDVLRGWSGRVWVDDEDEFAQHRSVFGYPEDLVRTATRSCESVRAALAAGRAPYDRVAAEGWLRVLARATVVT